MSLEQDVAAARRAVDALEQACAPVAGHFGDTVDSRRLRVDIARIRDDLPLLCGAEPAARRLGRGLSAGVVWDDGFDDGVSSSGQSAR
jgi:hypothetical protein